MLIISIENIKKYEYCNIVINCNKIYSFELKVALIDKFHLQFSIMFIN
jgi:hypothetical protein